MKAKSKMVNNSDKGLTAKQERFVQEYLVDLNATQAAIRAGYSEKRADQTGYENLRKPEIQKRIQALKDKTADKLEITAERVLQERAKIAFANAKYLYDGVIVRASDKNKALDALDKYLGVYEKDNQQQQAFDKDVQTAVLREVFKQISDNTKRGVPEPRVRG